MNHNKKPDFIGIGAQKSGTSWLHENLKNHADFDLLPIKEAHYFTRDKKYSAHRKLTVTSPFIRFLNLEYAKNASKRLRAAKLTDKKTYNFYKKWFFGTYCDSWYLSLFEEYKGISGETSPSYCILSKQDIKRLYNLLPDVKIIFLLRNPIERAWSSYRFKTRKITDNSINLIDESRILRHINTKSQLARSDYKTTIDHFTSVFPKEQFKIGFFDAIEEQPQKLLQEVTNYLGATSDFQDQDFNFDKVINESKILKCPDAVRAYLMELYYPQIKALAEHYGGYFNQWLNKTYGEQSSHPNKTLSPTMTIV